MNSGSGRKLSLEELKQLHQPTPTPQVPTTTQSPVQERTPPLEVHPTKEEWEEMMDYLYTLGYHAEKQTGLMKKVSELLTQLPTRMQMDELLKAVKHLEWMAEQAGKQKEKRFSLPGIRLPRLHLSLPEWDWPTVVTVMMALAVAALLLLWWKLGGDWSRLSQLIR